MKVRLSDAADGAVKLSQRADNVDGYHRDMNVFADDITIEDDMSVLVKYANGATMTYHLTAYSVSGISHSHVIPQCPLRFRRRSNMC
jgi:hypothetical protein